MPDQKYYIGKLKIICGEYSFDDVFRFKTAESPDHKLKEFAANLYENPSRVEGTSFYFNNDEVCVSAACWTELANDVFKSLADVIKEA